MNHQRLADALIAISFVALPTCALAQPSFGLDDAPTGPIVGPLGFGNGAEDPYGFLGPGGFLAPSPSLGAIGPQGDGAILAPGPVISHIGPDGFYVSSFSRNHDITSFNVRIHFSVDRVTRGEPNSPVMKQSSLGQAQGDMFSSAGMFQPPAIYVGTIPPGAGYVGPLGALVGTTTGNLLTHDESVFGLTTPSGVVPAYVPVVPPVISGPGTHDNLDSYDKIVFDPDFDGAFDEYHYFTVYPDGGQPGAIYAVAVGDSVGVPVPYANFFDLGLIQFEDAIDGLIMFDIVNLPTPGSSGPGLVDPGVDFALFSLAPGSFSLNNFGLSAGDVFFTDFQGSYALYADGTELGLNPSAFGPPAQSENIDALDLYCPADVTTTGTAAGDPGYGSPDCSTDLSDLLYFVNLWSASLIAADVTTTGTGPGNPCYSVPDGSVDLADLLFFVNEWSIGSTLCP